MQQQQEGVGYCCARARLGGNWRQHGAENDAQCTELSTPLKQLLGSANPYIALPGRVVACIVQRCFDAARHVDVVHGRKGGIDGQHIER